jgi:hypothetical protein
LGRYFARDRSFGLLKAFADRRRRDQHTTASAELHRRLVAAFPLFFEAGLNLQGLGFDRLSREDDAMLLPGSPAGVVQSSMWSYPERQ